MVKVAPSLLAADFRVMGAEIERMAAAGADYLHFDVMDGSLRAQHLLRLGHPANGPPRARCRWTPT